MLIGFADFVLGVALWKSRTNRNDILLRLACFGGVALWKSRTNRNEAP